MQPGGGCAASVCILSDPQADRHDGRPDRYLAFAGAEELLETEKHDVGDILQESLEHEKTAVASYYELLKVSEGKSVLLEEYAREMIVGEELHLDEVNKMLRKSGDVKPFRS